MPTFRHGLIVGPIRGVSTFLFVFVREHCYFECIGAWVIVPGLVYGLLPSGVAKLWEFTLGNPPDAAAYTRFWRRVLFFCPVFLWFALPWAVRSATAAICALPAFGVFAFAACRLWCGAKCEPPVKRRSGPEA